MLDQRIRAPVRIHARSHAHTDKYVILNAFSRQLLRERASVLRYTYIACLVIISCAVNFIPSILHIVCTT